MDNQKVIINPTHHYFYQIQGQLEIADKEYCYLVTWTPAGIIYIKIQRDREFFQNEMLPKLLSFYFNALLPEIVDSRKKRGMAIRPYPENPESNFNATFI